MSSASRPFVRIPARTGLAASLLLAASSATAVEFQAGDWTLDIGGFINAYYTYVDCGNTAVPGLALADRGLGCGGQDDRSTVGNGLLPNALVTKARSTQGDYDVSATIAIMAHTATSSAIAPNSGVDVRQAFFTVGNADIGTLKLGRDYGLFGAHAILNDMTLLGVGMPIQATQRGRVTLGHIGAGYSYLGHYGQFVWTSPAASGFTFDVGVMSPVDNGGAYVSDSAPQFQARVTYTNEAVKLWAGGKSQRFQNALIDDDHFTMRGLEVGGSLTMGRFSALFNVQRGSGLGILSDGDQEDTDSTNWLVQGNFAATEKLKLGLNHGRSRNREQTAATAGLEANSNTTLGAYYALTPGITLVAELSRTTSEAFSGAEVDMDGASIGGILFF